jgi:DNA polymerase-1
VRKEAEQQGFVETLFGRRRPTPDIKSSNFAVREAAYRAAINMPLQGSAADLMKMAMIEVQKNLDQLSAKSSKLTAANRPQMLLQIHDSILVETPESLAKHVGDLLKDIMEKVHKLPVKLKVDISTGKNWGQL